MVADLSGVANITLFASSSHNAYSGLSQHITKSVRFGKGGVHFPLKKRYDESNITLEGVEAEMDHHNPHDPPADDPQEDHSGPVFGASDNWLTPFDPSAETGVPEKPDETEQPKPKEGPSPSAYIDKLGRVYPVDVYGNIIRNTGRPFGVSTEQWTKASRHQRK